MALIHLPLRVLKFGNVFLLTQESRNQLAFSNAMQSRCRVYLVSEKSFIESLGYMDWIFKTRIFVVKFKLCIDLLEFTRIQNKVNKSKNKNDDNKRWWWWWKIFLRNYVFLGWREKSWKYLSWKSLCESLGLDWLLDQE